MESSLTYECKIVVAGDVTIDWLQWTTKYDESFEHKSVLNWTLYPGFRMKAEQGGALLLARMVKEATKSEVATHLLNNIENIPPDYVIHSLTVLDAFPLFGYEGDGKYRQNKVFRVKHHVGFCGSIINKSILLQINNDSADADIIILDDAGNGFRDEKTGWPKAILTVGKHPIIILKMNPPLAYGALWDHLVTEHSENLILIVDANDFRKLGINISRQLSWELTTEDFCRQITNNSEIMSIAACKNLIVRFGLDGVIHYTNTEGKINVSLFFDPIFREDQYSEQYVGDMNGVSAAFVAAFAAEVCKEGLNGIENGIFEGIQRSRQLLKMGFGDAKGEPSYPISKLFKPNNEQNTICKTTIPDFKDKASGEKNNWRLLEECTRGMLEPIAFNAVKNKTEEALKQVPGARFGKLFTLDREEIESFQSIKNLMSEYLERTEINIPLSIAVFGPPGSGKSFGVTELALSLDQKLVVKMEFNISQFASIDDLATAFHKVRDEALKGKMPLVFFDEFDAAFNGKLGWLKYFLAPMQDGMFKDGEKKHPIGRSIFVFAGGTSHTFKQFSREYFNEDINEDDRKRILKEFSDARGPDFISLLRGYVNIPGINRTRSEDDSFIIRRALIFRSLLQLKAPHIFDNQGFAYIDSGVLRAFLRVPTYKHGVRSMAGIIDMCILAGRRWFTQAALPPSEQLELHVNSEVFSSLLNTNNPYDTNETQIYQDSESEIQRTSHNSSDIKQIKPVIETTKTLPEEYSPIKLAFDPERLIPTIGIITALPKEYAAIYTLLENKNDNYNVPGFGAGRRYCLGEIPTEKGIKYNLVLVTVGMGNNIAATRASILLEHFPNVKSLIMVGIAGGIPNPDKVNDHVRLGDIVVSNEKGIIQYDYIENKIEKVEYRNPPRPPSAGLLEAVRYLEAGEILGNRPWEKYINQALSQLKLERPSEDNDVLYSFGNRKRKVEHPKDPKRIRGQPRVFTGSIASANILQKNPIARDELRERFKVKAIEMEGSGIADATWNHEVGYLVVRGICDYCDSYKNDEWQQYAAVVAAAYTRALIESMP